jgi:hypothetical protein
MYDPLVFSKLGKVFICFEHSESVDGNDGVVAPGNWVAGKGYVYRLNFCLDSLNLLREFKNHDGCWLQFMFGAGNEVRTGMFKNEGEMNNYLEVLNQKIREVSSSALPSVRQGSLCKDLPLDINCDGVCDGGDVSVEDSDA